ncbi:tRNA (guanine(10)-N(2))-dimethyltransferase [Candidatus Woesearchaeota archaeon]|nr:tRNA (guanine(10)-N(2))-dimethyltransferase [Candidatus Woesearchaeota archaeon]
MKYIKENEIIIPIAMPKKISKELPVFYNPVMKLNRDLSVALLKALSRKQLQIALPLAGTGVRGARFLKELPISMIKEIQVNDHDAAAVKKIKELLIINKLLASKKIIIHHQDANDFLLASSGFDYIDIDPFGTPNPFLDSAIKRLSRSGILAVTATDTSALAGTYPDACQRKYWAAPLRNYLMHEIGLRILIRKVQLIGSQYGKALAPIFSYTKEHYYRVFFSCVKGKKTVDSFLQQHAYFLFCKQCFGFKVSAYNQDVCCKNKMIFAGPLWIGNLWDSALVKNMELGALEQIKEESLVDVVGFYDIHELVSRYKLEMPKFEEIMNQIRTKGYQAARTHISPYGIRTNASLKEVIKCIKKC